MKRPDFGLLLFWHCFYLFVVIVISKVISRRPGGWSRGMQRPAPAPGEEGRTGGWVWLEDQTRPGQPLLVSELLAGSLTPCKTWDSLACEPVGSAACPAAVSCLPAHSPPLAHHVHNLFTKSTLSNMSTMFTILFIMPSGHCPPPPCPPYPQLAHQFHHAHHLHKCCLQVT